MVHDRVASDVATRYLLTYTPTNQKVDGTFRAIRLTAADPTLIVRTQRGYFAPRPPPVRPTLELTAVDEARRVLDVTREDLVVVEDGVPQTVEAFSEATIVPPNERVHFALVEVRKRAPHVRARDALR